MKKLVCVCGVLLVLMTGCLVNSPLQYQPSVEPSPAIQNGNPHEVYIKAMEVKDNFMNRRKKNGEFENKYAFYDIDGNGIDELIVSGGYMAYSVYTPKDKE